MIYFHKNNLNLNKNSKNTLNESLSLSAVEK